MITEDQIKTLATKYQTTELNLFLAYFYEQPQSSNIYFKGGTALRVIYQSPRFSEDLDFSTKLKNTKEIEQALIETLEALEKEGIETSLLEAKKTSGGFLASINFHMFDRVILLQLEISLRDGEKRWEVETIVSDFIPAYTIISLSRKQLIEEKIQALLSRKKPRDFYDLYFILRSNLLPGSKKSLLSDVFKTLQKTDINFEKELKEFLPKTHWAIIRNFKKTLASELNRYKI